MKIELIKGDITKLEVDAIVNAANSSLLGGGGVDGAIHRSGGKEILEECIQIGGCPVGEAVITTAGKMKAKKVIHTVGPRWNGGKYNEAEKLKNCYLNSLRIAEENGLGIIAFPNISTGIYGYPKEEAAKIAIDAVKKSKVEKIDKVIFVCFEEENYQIYRRLLKK